MAGVIDDASWPMCPEMLEHIAFDYSDWMTTLYSGDTRAGSDEEASEPSQGAAEKLIMDVVFEPEAGELYSETLAESCQYEDDVGVDLRATKNAAIQPISKATIGLGVRARLHSSSTQYPLPWFLMARSSITKTPLILQNSVGLIDPGYRGEVKSCAIQHERPSVPCPDGTATTAGRFLDRSAHSHAKGLET